MNVTLTERALAAAAAMLLATSAAAVPFLRISDGATTLTLVDGGVGDSDARTGVVAFSGHFVGYELGLVSGMSLPLPGSAAHPATQVDLRDIRSTSAGGMLSVQYSLTDLGPSTDYLPHFTLQVTSDGAIQYALYVDPDNNPLARTQLLAAVDAPSGTLTESGQGLMGTTDGSYSLTQVITLQFTDANQRASARASVNGGATNVPAPGMHGLLGAGLLALGWVRARKPSLRARRVFRPA